MVFIGSGEAGTAQSQVISITESTVELLAWLMAELARRRAEKQEVAAEEQGEAPVVPPESESEAESEDFSPDRFLDGITQTTMAATAVNLVGEYGKDDRYKAEAYSIKGETDSGKEIYTIRDAQHETVMQFEKLGERFVILEDNSTEAQRAEFAQASQNLKEQGYEQINQDASYKTQLKNLGDLAPAGSKAVVVANTILDQTRQDSYTGTLAEGQTDRYTLSRDADGAVTVRDNDEGCDVLSAYDGKIQQGMSEENLQHFAQLYDRLDVQQQISRQPDSSPPAAATPQRSAEEWSQAEAEKSRARPEYAPVMMAIQEVAQEKSTLPEFCQELEQRGIHAEITLKDGELGGIAYKANDKWIPGHALGERYTLAGVQQHLEVDAQTERDLPLLQEQGHVYRNITEETKVAAVATAVQVQPQVAVEEEVKAQTVVETASAVRTSEDVQLETRTAERELGDPWNANNIPPQEAFNTDRPIENPGLDDRRTIDVDPLGTVDVEPLGKWEQGVEQDFSPKVAELAEWLIAAQTLGRGQDEIDHIKRLARESTASTGRSFKSLYQQNPQWSNPDYAMPPLDWQKMQSDLTMFAELKRDVGEAGVVLLHKRQTSTSEPMNIQSPEDLTQACTEIQQTLSERDQTLQSRSIQGRSPNLNSDRSLSKDQER